MRKSSILILIQLLACTLGYGQSKSALPRVAIAGLAIESSTFSPAVSEEEAFRVRRGEDVFSYYPFLSPGSPDRKRAEWFPRSEERRVGKEWRSRWWANE